MAEKPTYEELERRVQELEKAESEHNLAEDRLKKIFDNTQDAIFIHDLEGNILDVNDKMCRMYGLTKEEALEVTIEDVSSSRMSMKVLLERWQKILNGEKLLFEWEARRPKDESVFNAEVSIQKISFHDKDIVLANIRDITERKRAEEALRERKEKYRLLFNMGVNAMFLVDNNTTQILECNNKASQLFGYSPQELLSMKMTDLSTTPETTRRACQEKVSKKERVYQKKNGGLISVDITSEHFYLVNRAVHISAIRDITRRKRAEEALRESNKTAHQFFSESSAGAFFMMLDEPVEWNDSVDKEKVLDYVFDHQRITKINRAMLGQYLASEKDFLCMTPKQLFAHDLEHGRLLWRKMFDQGFLDIESDERRFDGSQMWIIGSYRCMSDEQGRITGHFGTQLDITEHKRIMEDLRNDRERMDHILRATRTNMNTLDSEYNLRQVDAVWQKIYGDPQGQKCYKYFMDLDKPCEGCCVPKALATREIVVTEEFLHKENRHIEVHTIPFQDENGEWLVTEFNINITERKQAEAEREKLQNQLHQARKMESVGRLAGGVAHDFNNMLGVILGHTELALLKMDEDNELVSDLNEIQKAAQRSVNITKQLLAFARKQTISPKKIDLNYTVESMLNMLRRLIGEDIDLVWQPASQLWPVKMDPSQIDQILVNLCVNARDSISGVGKLTIQTGKKTFDEAYCKEHPGFITGDFVLLAVSDNGCGMDKDTLDNLFEPFFTTKDVGKGTGLGLATIYGIVNQNNGSINVYSEPNQGSTFKIYLPRLVTEENADKAVPEKNTAAGGTETILLVEDEPTILRMAQVMLERKGYSVLSAATPAEAIDLAKAHADKIHLLMSDVVMPEMNGRELAGQITALYPDIRLLFMSGYTADVIAHQGVLDDGVAFIQKPFSMADMTAKIREVLDKAPDETQG